MTDSPWADIVGPCYTMTSMARALGWTEAEVKEAGNDLRLLMLHSDDDLYLFPAFQLLDGKIVEGWGRCCASSRPGPRADGRGRSG